MAGKPSPRFVEAMKLLPGLARDEGMSPYAAAKCIGIGLNTMYRARLYKAWLTAHKEPDPAKRDKLLQPVRDELAQREAEFAVPFVRVVKKPQRARAAPKPTNKQH